MKKQVTRIVRYVPSKENYSIISEGKRKQLWIRDEQGLRDFGCKIPDKKSYKVKYQLDPKGKLEVCVSCGIPDVHPVGEDRSSNYANVCFLPKEWNHRLVTRTVEIIGR